MPPGEVSALRDQTVSTSRRQPLEAPHLVWSQSDAIAHLAAAMDIIGTAAGPGVEELASNIGEINVAAILVLQLDETAAAASIAQALPFRRRQGFERFALPERGR